MNSGHTSESVDATRGACTKRMHKHHETQRRDNLSDLPVDIPAAVVDSILYPTPTLSDTMPAYMPNDGYQIQNSPPEVPQSCSQPSAVDQGWVQEEHHVQSPHHGGTPQLDHDRVVVPVMSQYAAARSNNLEYWKHRNLGVEFEAYLNSGQTYGFDWFMRNPPNRRDSSGWQTETPAPQDYSRPLDNSLTYDRSSTQDLRPDSTCTSKLSG